MNIENNKGDTMTKQEKFKHLLLKDAMNIRTPIEKIDIKCHSFEAVSSTIRFKWKHVFNGAVYDVSVTHQLYDDAYWFDINLGDNTIISSVAWFENKQRNGPSEIGPFGKKLYNAAELAALNQKTEAQNVVIFSDEHDKMQEKAARTEVKQKKQNTISILNEVRKTLGNLMETESDDKVMCAQLSASLKMIDATIVAHQTSERIGDHIKSAQGYIR